MTSHTHTGEIQETNISERNEHFQEHAHRIVIYNRHTSKMINLNLPLRILQAVVALATLVLQGYVTHWYLQHTRSSVCPDAPVFLLSVAAFTLLTFPYLLLNAPLQITHANKAANSKYFNKWVVLVLDTLTCILWFVGWVNLAQFRGHLVLCGGHVCGFMGWGAGVGGLAWLAYLATTVLATLHVLRTRGGSSSNTTQPQTHDAWVGMQQKS